MDPISRVVAAGAAGAGGAAGAALYVDDVFSTYLYDGTGAAQTITNGIDLSGEGGLVWIKARSEAYGHFLYDTERGANERLASNSSGAESTQTGELTSFNSTGFSLGTALGVNQSTPEYCSWTFRKAPGFFDVVTYTGNGTAGRTISHSLGSEPGVIIVKRTDSADNWAVYHRSTGATKYLMLDQDNAAATLTSHWNDTAPTSSVFTVGDAARTNDNSATYVAYLFAHDDQSFGTNSNEAIIKCGSYTATGSAQTIDLGFEPQFLITKKSSGVGEWRINDAMRGIVSGGADAQLDADSTAAELTGNVTCDLTATGFITNGSQNDSGATYIYIAIRRPHKPPEAGTDVFNPSTQVGTVPNFAANFPVDFAIRLLTAGGNTTYSQMAVTRLTGEKFLATSQNNAEATPSGFSIDWDYMDGWGDLGGSGYGLSFKRAPGFFDVVTYTGTGTTTRQISHNLGSTPELIIVKRRNTTGVWLTWNSSFSLSNGEYILLNSSGAAGQSTPAIFTSSAPTGTYFNVSHDSGRNLNYDTNVSGSAYITYLFASLEGISKVGSYSGTGNNVDVDCGFTAGARFVLIKRTDSTGDWYVWDTTRGIVSGDDPYILLNSTAAQVTNTDYLDPLNAGFTVTSSAPAALNTSGGTYLFLAIA